MQTFNCTSLARMRNASQHPSTLHRTAPLAAGCRHRARMRMHARVSLFTFYLSNTALCGTIKASTEPPSSSQAQSPCAQQPKPRGLSAIRCTPDAAGDCDCAIVTDLYPVSAKLATHIILGARDGGALTGADHRSPTHAGPLPVGPADLKSDEPPSEPRSPVYSGTPQPRRASARFLAPLTS
jgi:hypothetical protein